MVPWSPHQTLKMRPYLGLVVYPLYSPKKSRLTRAVVGTVRIPWSSWCNCGHPLKIALTTGLYMLGAAQEVAARGRAAGMFLIQNKPAKDQRKTMWSATASERGAASVTMKIMRRNLSASLLDAENISAHRQRR
jgi:hypothetical protein